MDDDMIATYLENLDRRLARVEQFLPTLATKDEVKTLATKEELKTLATKEELKTLATKEELRAAVAPLATKDELKTLATKEELRAALAPLATKEEVREEGERLRRHMTMLIEHQDSKIELLAEHVLSSLRKPSKE